MVYRATDRAASMPRCSPRAPPIARRSSTPKSIRIKACPATNRGGTCRWRKCRISLRCARHGHGGKTVKRSSDASARTRKATHCCAVCSPSGRLDLQHVGAVGKAADRQRHAQSAAGQRRHVEAAQQVALRIQQVHLDLRRLAAGRLVFDLDQHAIGGGQTASRRLARPRGCSRWRGTRSCFAREGIFGVDSTSVCLREIGNRLRLHPAIDDVARGASAR